MHNIIGIVLIKTPAQILQSVLDITARDVEIGLAITRLFHTEPLPGFPSTAGGLRQMSKYDILDAAVLLDPFEDIAIQVRRERSRHSPWHQALANATMEKLYAAEMGISSATGTMQRTTLEDLLRRWGCEASKLTIALPGPVALLAVRKKWETLVMPRWLPDEVELPAEWRMLWEGPEPVVAPSINFQSARNEGLVDTNYLLRELCYAFNRQRARGLANRAQVEHLGSADDIPAELHDTFVHEHLVRSALAHAGASLDAMVERDQKHKIATIIKAMMLADTLKSRSLLGEAILRSIDIVMPADVCQQLRDLMEQGCTKVVGAATLVRSQLLLDVGYMLWWRKYYAALKEAGGLTVVASTDASQTADREWLVTEVHMVRNSDLKDLADSVDELWQMRQASYDEEDEKTFADMQLMNQRIIRVSSSHLMPPMVLGAKLTDMVHKIFRILWKFYLDTGSWAMVNWLFTQIIAWTTDWGTESLAAELPNFTPALLASLFPGTTFHAFEADHDDDVEGIGCSRDESLQADRAWWESAFVVLPAAVDHLFKFALRVQGGLHINNNIAKDLANCLELFPWWRKLADGLSFFMRHKVSREAFEGLCMQSPEAKPWLPVVRSFAGDLIDWRFGAAEGLARDCGAIETPLRLFWDNQKMKAISKQSAGRSDDADAKQRTAVEAIKEALASTVFFVFNLVFLELLQVLAHIDHWMEGCICHPAEFDETLTGAKRRKLYATESGQRVRPKCPQACCRASELAAGKMEELLNEAFEMVPTAIVRKCVGLPGLLTTNS